MARAAPRRTRGASVFAEAYARASRIVDRLTAQEWPSEKWKDDPVGFAREVLGIQVLPHQTTILEAIIKHDRVAIASGQKIGKTAAIIICAIHFFCSHENARVILSARTDYQVNSVMFRELRMVVRAYQSRTGRSLGELGNTARSGLVAPDLREIKGHTVREVEAISGTSGGNLVKRVAKASIMYLVDEASGLPQDVFEAMDGNLSGGGKLVLISNPTRAEEGTPFFDAFHTKRDFWWTWQINSEEIAKAYEHLHISGLVDARQIAIWRDEYGEDSPFTK